MGAKTRATLASVTLTATIAITSCLGKCW